MNELKKKFTSYLISHLRNCFSVLGNLYQHKITTITITAVLAITLALPTGLWTLFSVVKHLPAKWQQSCQLSIYINQANASESDRVISHLKQQDFIDKIETISPQQALEQLSNELGQQHLLSNFSKNNPLPITIIAEFNQYMTPEHADNLAKLIDSFSGVDSIHLDLDWINKISTLVNLLQMLTYCLTIFLGIAVVLIVANITNSTVKDKMATIKISKLIGATNNFIRREFIYLGFWYSCLAAVFATCIINGLLSIINPYLNRLGKLYSVSIKLPSISFSSMLILIIISCILGVIAAWVACNKQLKTLDPT